MKWRMALGLLLVDESYSTSWFTNLFTSEQSTPVVGESKHFFSCEEKIVSHIIESIKINEKLEGNEMKEDFKCLKAEGNGHLQGMGPGRAKSLVEAVVEVKDRSKRNNIAAGVKQYIATLVGEESINRILGTVDDVSKYKQAAIDANVCGPTTPSHIPIEQDNIGSILSVIYLLEQLQVCPIGPTASDESHNSESLIHNQELAVRELAEVAHIMAVASHESVKGSAIVMILNTYIDLVQRGLIQLATLHEESIKLDKAEKLIVSAMGTYFMHVKIKYF